MPHPPKNNQLENDFRKFQDCYRRDEAERNKIKADLANLSLLVASMVKNPISSLVMQFAHVKSGGNTEKMNGNNTDIDMDTAKLANAIIVATSTINARVEILEGHIEQIKDAQRTKIESMPSAIITRVKKIENQLNIMKKKSDDMMDIDDNKIREVENWCVKLSDRVEEVENLCVKLSDRVEEVEHSCAKLIIYTEEVLKDDIEKLKSGFVVTNSNTTRNCSSSDVNKINTQIKIMKHDFETIENNFSEFKRQTEGWLANMNGITTYFSHKSNFMLQFFTNKYQEVYDRIISVETVAGATEKLVTTVNNGNRRLLKKILKLSDQVTDLEKQVPFDEIDANVNSSFLYYQSESCNELDEDFTKDILWDSTGDILEDATEVVNALKDANKLILNNILEVDDQLSDFRGSIEQVYARATSDYPSSHREAIDFGILATTPPRRTSIRGELDEAMDFAILLTNPGTRGEINNTPATATAR